jgi:hypothetical protein
MCDLGERGPGKVHQRRTVGVIYCDDPHTKNR